MKLSREFTPWVTQLERFPLELALGLAPLLRQLWSALDGEGKAVEGDGDPDGIDGVTQRERYERLLTSQWLLASEVPLEFLRRAAMQELIFLKTARRMPSAGRRCHLVLDAGPSQLGSPRLVQIAMLLVLERRATQRRAELQWTMIQEPGVSRLSAGQSDILAMLQARSRREPTPEDFETLAERCGPLSTGDELFWVGGTRLCQLATTRGGQRLTISDPLSEKNDELAICIDSGSRRRSLSLSLPTPEIRTRLIRRPFEVAASPRQLSLETSGDVSFSADGRRVLVRDGDTLVAHLPTPSSSSRRRRFTISPGGRVIGLGWHNKQLLALCQRTRVLSLESPGHSWELRTREYDFALPLDGSASCKVLALGRNSTRFFILDAKGALYTAGPARGAHLELTWQTDGVVDWRMRHGSIALARRTTQGSLEVRTLSADFEFSVALAFECKDPPVVVAGFDSIHNVGVFAVQVERNVADRDGRGGGPGGAWTVVGSGTSQRIVVDDMDAVVACVPASPPDPSPGRGSTSKKPFWALVVHCLDDNGIYVVSGDSRRKVTTISDPDSTLHWDERAARLLYRDTLGRIYIVDTHSTKAPYRLDHSNEAEAR